LYFGFDARRMLIRLDTQGIARKILGEHAVESLRVDFHVPAGYRIIATSLASNSPVAQIERETQAIAQGGIELAVGKIVELAVPFEKLEAKPDQPVSFSVELFAADASIDRLPREGTIDMVVPSPEYEKIMWQV
jgi:hypothetical protein